MKRSAPLPRKSRSRKPAKPSKLPVRQFPNQSGSLIDDLANEAYLAQPPHYGMVRKPDAVAAELAAHRKSEPHQFVWVLERRSYRQKYWRPVDTHKWSLRTAKLRDKCLDFYMAADQSADFRCSLYEPALRQHPTQRGDDRC
jgi:hypothetical protein